MICGIGWIQSIETGKVKQFCELNRSASTEWKGWKLIRMKTRLNLSYSLFLVPCKAPASLNHPVPFVTKWLRCSRLFFQRPNIRVEYLANWRQKETEETIRGTQQLFCTPVQRPIFQCHSIHLFPPCDTSLREKCIRRFRNWLEKMAEKTTKRKEANPAVS